MAQNLKTWRAPGGGARWGVAQFVGSVRGGSGGKCGVVMMKARNSSDVCDWAARDHAKFSVD